MLKDNYVELKSFTKIYKQGKKNIYACENIDFKAQKGSITGLLGPNGAGKSTLLKALCGVHYATNGSINVCGFTDSADIREVCGYVPEFPILEANMTVQEVLLTQAALHKLDKKEAIENIKKASNILNLNDVLDAKVKTLSKGYKQRVSFAKALSFNPTVLVLDEFSAGLDPAQVVSLRKSIKHLAKDKIIILSTHRIEEAESLCDNVYILSQGKMVCSGTIKEITTLSKTSSLEQAFLKLTATGDSL